MRFDAYAALANLRLEGGGRATPATPATRATQRPDEAPLVAQVARVARRTASDAEISDLPFQADTCRTSRTCRTGLTIPWQGRGYPPAAIRQGVAEAFEDYVATDDPHDPRAWA